MRLFSICVLVLSIVLVIEGYIVRRKLRTQLGSTLEGRDGLEGKQVIREGIRIRSPVPEGGVGNGMTQDPQGRWLFDWLWGGWGDYGNGGYYPPPPPPVQYEHCVDYFDPLTHDLVTDCTPLRADIPQADDSQVADNPQAGLPQAALPQAEQ